MNIDTAVLIVLGVIITIVFIVWIVIYISTEIQQRKDYKEYRYADESYEDFCERFYNHYLK